MSADTFTQDEINQLRSDLNDYAIMVAYLAGHIDADTALEAFGLPSTDDLAGHIELTATYGANLAGAAVSATVRRDRIAG